MERWIFGFLALGLGTEQEPREGCREELFDFLALGLGTEQEPIGIFAHGLSTGQEPIGIFGRGLSTGQEPRGVEAVERLFVSSPGGSALDKSRLGFSPLGSTLEGGAYAGVRVILLSSFSAL